MNTRDLLQNQINHLRESMDRLELCFSTGITNDDGDLVIPEEQATLIKLLLEDG